MKLNPLICSLAACAALLPPLASAAPTAHPGHHKSTAMKPARRPAATRHTKPRGRAFILNGAVPGRDPNRMDHMAIGRKMHPERLDHMNAAPPARRAPVTPK